MKKTTLALAVAAALTGFGTAASADTTLYGSARASVNYVNPDGGNNDSWDVVNQASRLGVRGEEDLGGGLAAIYQYEFGVDLTEGSAGFESNRPKWVGLKGNSWGSLTLGTQWTPYYNVIGIGDIFNDATYTFSSAQYYLGSTYGRREDNSIMYSTPNWSGFSAQVMLVTNGNGGLPEARTPADVTFTSSGMPLPSNLSDGVDLWNIAASYKNGPFFVGATGMWLEGPSSVYTAPTLDGTQWGAAAGFNSGPFALTLSYENGNINRLYFDKTDSWYLTGQYTFGNNVVRAAYGYVDPEGTVNTAPTTMINQGSYSNYALGYQYNLSKRTRLWAEYIGRDGVDNNRAGYAGLDVVSIGTRVDF